MIISDYSIKTNRAFVFFSKIQHISWDIDQYKQYNLKIYTGATKPVNHILTKSEFQEFLAAYTCYEGVKFS